MASAAAVQERVGRAGAAATGTGGRPDGSIARGRPGQPARAPRLLVQGAAASLLMAAAYLGLVLAARWALAALL